MMVIMQFVFQIIILAVGFGVGYWLIITANSQEGTIKNFGQALGGVLIVMAMILEIFSCYYMMKLSNSAYLQSGSSTNGAVNSVQTDNNAEIEEKNEPESDKNIQSVNPPEGEDKRASLESKNIPIKKDKDDHE